MPTPAPSSTQARETDFVAAPGPQRVPLVVATATHLVVSQRVVLRLLTAMALLGITLGVVGLREAYTRLPSDGDTLLTVAIAVAVTVTALALFAGLVVIPRRVRRQFSAR